MKEGHIEQLAIELLKSNGFSYAHGRELAPDAADQERKNYQQVILKNRLISAVSRINPNLDQALQEDALKAIERIHSSDLLTDNESFHTFITNGVPVSYVIDGQERGDKAWLIDFDSLENNEFLVVNQFTVVEDNHIKRPDLILFVNGMPLVVVELKNATDETATIKTAFNQLETYKALIPALFKFNAFNIISDGLEAKAGTISAELTRYMTWRSFDSQVEASRLESQLEVLIKGMLNKYTLLDLIRHFIVFEKNKKEDSETGVISISTVKKLAAYHQYYAVNKAVESTLRASGYSNNQAIKNFADRKGGVVWHTQGSGKSLSMVFYTGKIVQALKNPTIIVITDRNDLDDQLFQTFAASSELLRQEPKQANSCAELKKYLKVSGGGIIFSTIQKFQPEEGNIHECLSERENIVVIADEAHRTQYGFKPKTIDEKNESDEVIGKKIVYGFAKYMRDALPYATYLGFTGTPVENKDSNTPVVFGRYVDIYDIAQAVEDGATVKIYYESRLVKVNLSDEGKQLIEDLDEELKHDSLTETQKAKAKWTQLEALIGSEKRIKNIAKDIVGHFESRQEVFDGKGMIVSMSRRIAADLYAEIIRIKPQWHSDDLNKGVIKVVMTSASSDGPKIAKHHTTKVQRQALADRMKDTDDELKLVIVRDMWLTGFDAPSMHTLYIDKPMQGHNLMQAIARVNRVYKDKPGGLVVDYLGIASDLKKALSFYSDSGGKGDPTVAQEQAVTLMLEKIEVISQMFHGFQYEKYFDANTSRKLSLILAAEDHILGLEDGKKRFVNEVTILSQAFAIAIPHHQATDVKEEVSFFQAVKARLSKFDIAESGKTNEEIETTIKQVIDKALVSDQVIDIFDAAGIKKPDISVLSDEFLAELQGMEHKNLALEAMKKLLNNEISARSKTNLIKAKSLRDMLDSSIKKYQNKILTAAEVMEELINLAKDVTNMDSEAESLGLSDYEYAFYSAVADNDSARELMQKDKLRELSIVLTERVRKNATIDWTIKESVKSKLKVTIKRTLRQYGYPPDMQKLATETVLKQAEMIADSFTKH
ncbi:type I restriction endonuclease subunit R [Thiotrichales bacterium 19X7-9]|nr:type I restriction endonuclease subunit R [Thiotrichales bacterium 19X7-9]